MMNQKRDLASIATRLERLERQNRRLRTGGLCLLTALVGLAVLAAGRPAPQFLEAREFRVVTRGGATLATLGAIQGGAGLYLMDKNMLVRVQAEATATSAEISLLDEQEKTRMRALVSGGDRLVTEDLGTIRLPTDTILNVYDHRRKVRASLRVADEPSLSLYDGLEKTLWMMPPKPLPKTSDSATP